MLIFIEGMQTIFFNIIIILSHYYFYILQVTVKFRVINGTAKEHEDFEVLSTTAILVDGAGSVDLPVRIINDNVPESNETFYIELLKQITGGGVLGTDSTTMAVVNIQASDDPVGAFGN